MTRERLLIGMIAILWIGMLLAIGMESVVKFEAHTLTKAVGFDVSRTVFGFFNKIQFILLIALLIPVITARQTSWVELIVGMAVGFLLIMQVFWLFPILNHEVDLILAGIHPLKSYQHALYGIIEIVKISLLSILAFKLLLQPGV